MALQKFTGRIVGAPKLLETSNTHRPVVHVRVSFMPEVKINGKLPEFKDGAISDIQFSIWDENFQQSVMADANSLIGKMVTGYCDGITQREQYYNGTCYAFVLDKNGKPNAPVFQVITKTTAPSAPVAPVV